MNHNHNIVLMNVSMPRSTQKGYINCVNTHTFKNNNIS